MRARLSKTLLAAIVASMALVPVQAGAVTLGEIVDLTHAGVSEVVILALIDRDKTIFSIEPEQLVALKEAGVSEPVILAMLKSGREEGERAAQAASDLNTAMIMASMAQAPEIVAVGHGPEVPNVAHPNGFYSAPPSGGYFTVPYGFRRGKASAAGSAPYVSPNGIAVVPPIAPVIPVAPRHVEPAQSPLLCLAQVNTATSMQPLSYVTPCPAIMQPGRRR